MPARSAAAMRYRSRRSSRAFRSAWTAARKIGRDCRGAWWRFSTRATGSTSASRASTSSRGARRAELLLAEIAEALVEAGELPARVQQLLLAAGPGRVRLRVDVEAQRIARLPVGGAGLVAGAVGHHHGDLVVIGVDAFLHGPGPSPKERLYSEA